MWKVEVLDLKLIRLFKACVRILLCVLIIVILIAILAGIAYTIYDFHLMLNRPFKEAFKSILIDTVTLMAIIEVFRTAMAYYSEGRVKVTHIIDSVIVTILIEAMTFWYQDLNFKQLVSVVVLVLSLAVVRLIAVRFPPRHAHEDI